MERSNESSELPAVKAEVEQETVEACAMVVPSSSADLDCEDFDAATSVLSEVVDAATEPELKLQVLRPSENINVLRSTPIDKREKRCFLSLAAFFHAEECYPEEEDEDILQDEGDEINCMDDGLTKADSIFCDPLLFNPSNGVCDYAEDENVYVVPMQRFENLQKGRYDENASSEAYADGGGAPVHARLLSAFLLPW